MISRLIAEGETQCAELHGRPVASPFRSWTIAAGPVQHPRICPGI